jgi:hypothetical protein
MIMTLVAAPAHRIAISQVKSDRHITTGIEVRTLQPLALAACHTAAVALPHNN